MLEKDKKITQAIRQYSQRERENKNVLSHTPYVGVSLDLSTANRRETRGNLDTYI